MVRSGTSAYPWREVKLADATTSRSKVPYYKHKRLTHTWCRCPVFGQLAFVSRHAMGSHSGVQSNLFDCDATLSDCKSSVRDSLSWELQVVDASRWYCCSKTWTTPHLVWRSATPAPICGGAAKLRQLIDLSYDCTTLMLCLATLSWIKMEAADRIFRHPQKNHASRLCKHLTAGASLHVSRGSGPTPRSYNWCILTVSLIFEKA